MKTEIKYYFLFFSLSILPSFAQVQANTNQDYFKKLIKIEKRPFWGYSYYSQNSDYKLSPSDLHDIYKSEKITRSKELLRNSGLVKIGAIIILASTAFIPTTKTIKSNVGGMPITIRKENYGNQILAYSIGLTAGLVFNFGRKLKLESVSNYNGSIKRKFYK